MSSHKYNKEGGRSTSKINGDGEVSKLGPDVYSCQTLLGL